MVLSARRARTAVPLAVLALVAAFAALPVRPAAAAAPADLSNFQGNFGCAAGVKLGRVTDVRGVQAAVRGAARVKATGLGHSWWRDNFCAGDAPSSVNVMTRHTPSYLRPGPRLVAWVTPAGEQGRAKEEVTFK